MYQRLFPSEMTCTWVAQMARYVVASGLAAIVHMAVFYLLAWKALPALSESDMLVSLTGIPVTPVAEAVRSFNSMVANLMAFLASNTVAYLINVVWVFEPGRHSRVTEFGLFYLVSGGAAVLGSAFMGALIRYGHCQTTVAFAGSLIVSMAINYSFRKKFIFRG